MDIRPAREPRLAPESNPGGAPSGSFALLDGDPAYRIAGYPRLEPFLMSLASDTDLWMFVASGGGLTAGRVDAEGALFPYLTSDRLHDAHHHTGPLTLIRVERERGESVLWEPFGEAGAERPGIERNLYKNTVGNRLVFEEVDHDLGLAFRYRWAGCDEFGWVRTVTLANRGARPMRARVLDGLRNLLPWGAPLQMYQQASNLVDAYKKNEVDPATGLGIFALTAGITDRAEALEVLRANTIWCCGLDDVRVCLSSAAIAAFRQDQVVPGESVVNGCRGNYLVTTQLDLEPGQDVRWHLAADVGRDHLQIAERRRELREGDHLAGRIDAGLQQASTDLRRNVASADGLQRTGQPASWSHHFANVLFNNMRGGVFTQNHDVPAADFAAFVQVRNRAVADRQRARLAALPPWLPVADLRALASDAADADLARLAHEYLPLYFGRRHGDPSRPWNRFTIRVRERDGERALHYEGNWRDIFQNWEALSVSFPGFLPNLVAKFVNASTVDGFNPYRLTRDGVDWEAPATNDPWGNIGYWGDHQIVYLLRLLEAMHRHDPAALPALLGNEIFSYAEVPYRLKPYAEILRDPRATVVYDTDLAARIDARVANLGTDGKLLTGPDGAVHHVNLFEKLLVPALSKLSNLIPDAGIWMNTQRPEWNDANNALAGGGVSVVTLCHLRRYLAFLADLLPQSAAPTLRVSGEVAAWCERIAAILTREHDLPASSRLDPRDRLRVLADLGGASSAYRETVYARGFSGRRDLATGEVVALCRAALAWVDRSLAANRRDDGLYHTYNLLEFTADGAGVEVAHLQEMLEGQVAVLSSGALQPAEGLTILERLFASDLYRPDQRSFLLYPARDRAGFLARNVVPGERVAAIPLLVDLLAAGDRSLLARDADGTCRFQGDLRHAPDLAAVLDGLGRQAARSAAVARDRAAVLALFEDVFAHRSYTGRSGVMYGYEGIGCIYWHMVAKLLLATQELVLRAERAGAPLAVREGLARMYLRIRAGIGYEKTVAEYGAFPTDPYSHTPAAGGAKQPGMTGQVKEEILTRFGEFGVQVEAGALRFAPVLLEAREFLAAPAPFEHFDVAGCARTLDLPADSLAFTLCQVPVVYRRTSGGAGIEVVLADGTTHAQPGNSLDAALSAEVFARNGKIASITVAVPATSLRGAP